MENVDGVDITSRCLICEKNNFAEVVCPFCNGTKILLERYTKCSMTNLDADYVCSYCYRPYHTSVLFKHSCWFRYGCTCCKDSHHSAFDVKTGNFVEL